jgi:hypothetical protein
MIMFYPLNYNVTHSKGYIVGGIRTHALISERIEGIEPSSDAWQAPALAVVL